MGFLEAVSASVRPAADEEIRALAQLKGGSGGGRPAGVVAPWDTEYLMAMARSRECTMRQRQLSE